MKTITFLLTFFIGLNGLFAQNDKKPASPKDSSEMVMGDLNIKVNYSSPSVKGRKIFGELVPYDKVWRTGANNATVFEINNPLMVEGKELPAGKYGLFTIPGENKWVIIFNSAWKQWGAYKYSEKKDVLRVEVPSMMIPEHFERFTIKLENGFMLIMWDHTSVQVALN